MSQVLEVKIPGREYPLVVLTNENSFYNADLNYINLRESDKYSGEVIGHELGEFFRERLKQQKKQEPLTIKEKIKLFFRYNPREENETEETHAHEFFGYLGTRILQDLVKERKAVKFGEKRKPIEMSREHILAHARPSRFAAQLDLSKIRDYKALFSLSDNELRYRFFRQDPQYDLSKPASEAKIARRPQKTEKLESIIKIIPILIIILSLILLIKINITGNAVINNSDNQQIPILVIFIISVIFLLIMRKKRKKCFTYQS